MAVETLLDEAKPKKRKGRTTSVSIMTSAAVKQMGKAWVVLPADSQLLAGLCKRTIFDLGLRGYPESLAHAGPIGILPPD